QGIQLLEDTKRLQQERLMMFHAELGNGASSPASPPADYEGQRDALMTRIGATLQQFINLHETGISVGVSRSRESSAQAEAVTEQLVLLALGFGRWFHRFGRCTII